MLEVSRTSAARVPIAAMIIIGGRKPDFLVSADQQAVHEWSYHEDALHHLERRFTKQADRAYAPSLNFYRQPGCRHNPAFRQSFYSVVFPLKCSLSFSASARVWWTTPSRWFGGA